MSSVCVQPVSTRLTDFQIQPAPSPRAWTAANAVTPSCRSGAFQCRRKVLDVAIMAKATDMVAAGRRSSCHWSGVSGGPASRLEITAIFDTVAKLVQSRGLGAGTVERSHSPLALGGSLLPLHVQRQALLHV